MKTWLVAEGRLRQVVLIVSLLVAVTVCLYWQYELPVNPLYYKGAEDVTSPDKNISLELKQSSSRETDNRSLMMLSPSAPVNNNSLCHGQCPPFQWSQWSLCSTPCGSGHRYRKRLYRYSCLDQSDVCSDSVEVQQCEAPCLFDPGQYGGPDGLPPYPANPFNPPLYPEDHTHKCGQWITKYSKLHNDILVSQHPQAYLIYSTGSSDHTAGSLADRLKGITTAFFLAMLLDRAFFIHWTLSPPITDFLLPKFFDWSDFRSIQHLPYSSPRDIGSWRAAKFAGYDSQWYMTVNFTQFLPGPVEVLQAPRYDYTFALLRNPLLMNKAFQLGLDQLQCSICCAFDQLFVPNPLFSDYQASLFTGIKSRELMSIQFDRRCMDQHVIQQLVNCSNQAVRDHSLNSFVKRAVVSECHAQEIAEQLTSLNIQVFQAKQVTNGMLAMSMAFSELYMIMNSSVLIRGKGYMASLGVMADALRRHYNPPHSVLTYVSSKKGCIELTDLQRIE